VKKLTGLSSSLWNTRNGISLKEISFPYGKEEVWTWQTTGPSTEVLVWNSTVPDKRKLRYVLIMIPGE